jgi:hypothetical protein
VPPESAEFCELTATSPSLRAAASTACAETFDGACNTTSLETNRVSPRGGMPVRPASPAWCAAGAALRPKFGENDLADASRPAAGVRLERQAFAGDAHAEHNRVSHQTNIGGQPLPVRTINSLQHRIDRLSTLDLREKLVQSHIVPASRAPLQKHAVTGVRAPTK